MPKVKNGTQRNYTRAEILEHMHGGGSYILDGEHYMTPDDLPGDSELAGDDPEAMAAASESLEKSIQNQLSELHKLQERRQKMGESRPVEVHALKRAQPRVAGPIPKDGPVQAAPIEPLPGAHDGDGHDPFAVHGESDTMDTSTRPFVPRPVHSAMRPGGVSQKAGPPPPNPILNSADARRYVGAIPSMQDMGGISEEDLAGEPESGAIPKSVIDLLGGMTEEQKAKAVRDAKESQAHHSAPEPQANPNPGAPTPTQQSSALPPQPPAQNAPLTPPITVSSNPTPNK